MENYIFDGLSSLIAVKGASSGVRKLPQPQIPRQQHNIAQENSDYQDKSAPFQRDVERREIDRHQREIVRQQREVDLHQQKCHIPVKSFYENYQVISNLGKGSFGSVTLARYRKDRQDLLRNSVNNQGTMLEPLQESYSHLDSLVAIKTMNKRLPALSDYHRVKEIKFIHSIPSHPALVQIYELFVDDTHYQLHIVMESMNSNLYQLVRHRNTQLFSAPTLKSILTQLLSAIRHIHKCDYFHRDIKPENILVVPTSLYYGNSDAIPPHRKGDNYIVKLADYGLARSIYNNRPYTAYVSTRWYRSPEILLRRKWYGKPFDVWAFGTVAVELANFCPLFPGENELEQIWKILTVLGHPSLPEQMPNSQTGYKIPLGGYWEEARILAAKLGIVLPYHEGESMSEVLPNPKYAGLQEVVKACLTWDPDSRADIDTVCSLPYFGNKESFRSHLREQIPVENKPKSIPKAQTKPAMKDAPSTFQVLSGIKLTSSNKLQASQNRIVKLASKVISSTLKEMNLGQENVDINDSDLNINNDYSYDDLDDGYETNFMGTEAFAPKSNLTTVIGPTKDSHHGLESTEVMLDSFEKKCTDQESADFTAQADETHPSMGSHSYADDDSFEQMQQAFSQYHGQPEEEIFATDLNRIPGELCDKTAPEDSGDTKLGPALFKVIDYDSDEQNSGETGSDQNYVWNELNRQCHSMKSQDLSLGHSEVQT